MHHLNFNLTNEEKKKLEEAIGTSYGSKTRLIRALLKRFFKEREMLIKEREEAKENEKS